MVLKMLYLSDSANFISVLTFLDHRNGKNACWCPHAVSRCQVCWLDLGNLFLLLIMNQPRQWPAAGQDWAGRMGASFQTVSDKDS